MQSILGLVKVLRGGGIRLPTLNASLMLGH
jgi:hypothetical protein